MVNLFSVEQHMVVVGDAHVCMCVCVCAAPAAGAAAAVAGVGAGVAAGRAPGAAAGRAPAAALPAGPGRHQEGRPDTRHARTAGTRIGSVNATFATTRLRVSLK